ITPWTFRPTSSAWSLPSSLMSIISSRKATRSVGAAFRPTSFTPPVTLPAASACISPRMLVQSSSPNPNSSPVTHSLPAALAAPIFGAALSIKSSIPSNPNYSISPTTPSSTPATAPPPPSATNATPIPSSNPDLSTAPVAHPFRGEAFPNATSPYQRMRPSMSVIPTVGPRRLRASLFVIPTGVPRLSRHAVEGSWQPLPQLCTTPCELSDFQLSTFNFSTFNFQLSTPSLPLTVNCKLSTVNSSSPSSPPSPPAPTPSHASTPAPPSANPSPAPSHSSGSCNTLRAVPPEPAHS